MESIGLLTPETTDRTPEIGVTVLQRACQEWGRSVHIVICWYGRRRWISRLVYRLSAGLPSNETYRLVGQMTRSAASVPANIAEGHARATTKDYSNFLAIAKGSLMETETFVMLSVRLSYVTPDEAQPALSLITETSKMLTVLRARLSE